METAVREKVGAWMTPEVADAAKEAAREAGITLSEYIRRAVAHLAATRSCPFPTHSGAAGRGRPRKVAGVDDAKEKAARGGL